MQQVVCALPLSHDDPFETEERKRLSPPPVLRLSRVLRRRAALLSLPRVNRRRQSRRLELNHPLRVSHVGSFCWNSCRCLTA